MLRQRVGNQAFQALKSQRADEALRRSQSIQAKLTISQPRDVHEQEADRVADAVMRMPSPDMQQMPAVSSAASIPEVQRMCAECEEELGKNAGAPVRRKEQTADVPPIMPSVDANIRALRGGGSALPTATRAFFEPRFGADFSDVRVHTSTRAEEAAQSINAKAFTLGRDIAFNRGQYVPESNEGRKLLAHELTHVVQQRAVPTTRPPIEVAGAVASRPTEVRNKLCRQPAAGPSNPPPASPMAGFAPMTIGACRIEFRKGTTDAVEPAARDACLEMARAYVESGGGQATVELHGYASEEGDPKFNADLARRRAEAAKRLLVARKVPAAAISAVGHGVDRTYAGLALNRRVEVVLVTSLTFPADEITIPKFVCGPDVTKQVEDAVTKARSLFAAWTSDQKDESCEDLRGITTGGYAWDIVELHNNDWILNYRPMCATQGATPPCGSTVQVGAECYYAGSPNYVIFGTMCKLCYDHFYAQGRAGANVGYTGWMDFTEKSMFDLIELYKSSSGNLIPSKAWAAAGRDGWPSGGKPSKGDRPGCAPQCSQPYTGPTFRVNWYPYEFHTG